MVKKKIGKANVKARETHPDHTAQFVAINRVIGQLEGIKKMFVERKYCPEIIKQIKAARGGLLSVEATVLSTHLSSCVHSAIKSGDEEEIDIKIDEIMKYVRSLI
jgi:DNA-binding FrmR family transcriptional regulator